MIQRGFVTVAVTVTVAAALAAAGCGGAHRSIASAPSAGHAPSAPASTALIPARSATPAPTPGSVGEPPAELLATGSAVACSVAGSAELRRLRETATFDGVTATLSAQPVAEGGAWRDVRLQVRRPGRAPTDLRLRPPDGFRVMSDPGTLQLESIDARTQGHICLGRMLGNRLVAVVGLRLGNDCCSGVVTIGIARQIGQPQWIATEGNGVQIATLGDRARVVSNVWMGCTAFWACAEGGSSIVVDDSDGVRLLDVTRTFPRLLQADARYLRSTVPALPSVGAGGAIAAWIADECRLGEEEPAWHWLDEQLVAGRLDGDRYTPGGKRLVDFLHTLLREHRFCTR